MQKKQFLEENLQQFNLTSRNKKKISNKPPNFTPKASRKEQKSPQSRKKEIIKIIAEINGKK